MVWNTIHWPTANAWPKGVRGRAARRSCWPAGRPDGRPRGPGGAPGPQPRRPAGAHRGAPHKIPASSRSDPITAGAPMSTRLHHGRLVGTVSEVVDGGFDLLPVF